MKSARFFAAGLVLCLPAGIAAAQGADFTTTRYMCDRGVEVPATYVNAGELSLVVLNVEGDQNTLLIEPSASGARYSWPSGGGHYVWWTKGDTAFLMWSEAGEEKVILDGCALQD